jgi:hypothetical protein
MGEASTVGVRAVTRAGAKPDATVRPRARGRLSRTLSGSRWYEYFQLLERAAAEGYAIVALEEWLADDDQGERVLVLRHDVDQCPRSAMRMLAVEQHVGVQATWYFRWRTARPRAVKAVLAAGGQVGLHYETLSRRVIEQRAAGHEVDPAREIEAAQRQLKRELIAWSVLFGPARSACAHGDTRAQDVNNAVLLRDADLSDYGLEYDANFSMRSHDLAVWLTDRSRAEGSWRDGLDATEIIASHASPVLLLTHPNNWISGAGLWYDRAVGTLLPEPRLGARYPLRSGSDSPPLDT